MTDYSTMSDFEISHAVAKASGFNLPNPASLLYNKTGRWEIFDPCNNPADAWPIILENGINIFTDMIPHGLLGQARVSVIDDGRIGSECLIAKDKNPLRAAMLVFLMMKDDALNAQGEKI